GSLKAPIDVAETMALHLHQFPRSQPLGCLSPYHFLSNTTATTDRYTLSLHDALPIWVSGISTRPATAEEMKDPLSSAGGGGERRSEEHTSELQSLAYLVCRLLLEKNKPTPMLRKELTSAASSKPISVNDFPCPVMASC